MLVRLLAAMLQFLEKRRAPANKGPATSWFAPAIFQVSTARSEWFRLLNPSRTFHRESEQVRVGVDLLGHDEFRDVRVRTRLGPLCRQVAVHPLPRFFHLREFPSQIFKEFVLGFHVGFQKFRARQSIESDQFLGERAALVEFDYPLQVSDDLEGVGQRIRPLLDFSGGHRALGPADGSDNFFLENHDQADRACPSNGRLTVSARGIFNHELSEPSCEFICASSSGSSCSVAST
jgi:hypothetical protein